MIFPSFWTLRFTSARLAFIPSKLLKWIKLNTLNRLIIFWALTEFLWRLKSFEKRSPKMRPCKQNIWRILNTIASIWLQKYAQIFVLGHYLFLEAHIFPRASSLSENCSLHVRGQISVHIFAPNGGYCLYINRRLLSIDNRLAKIYNNR